MGAAENRIDSFGLPGPARSLDDEADPDADLTSDQTPQPPMSSRIRSGLLKLAVGLLAGLLIGATASTAQGSDLRPDRTSDLAELVSQAEQRRAELASRAVELRQQNQALTEAQGAPIASPDPSEQELHQIAGLAAVEGPAVRVTLTDAPADFAPPGVDGDLLVVHEQDIQRVMNALFAAGAEAMTIQDQRVIATTAVKCVGNTVVLHGVPYAPPYVITAIGDQAALEAGLAADNAVQIYRQYAKAYQLGYQQQRIDQVTMSAFNDPVVQVAKAQR